MPPDDPAPPPLLKIDEVAARLRVSRRTIRRWKVAGKLPTVTLPSGQIRFRQADVDAILATATDTPKDVPA